MIKTKVLAVVGPTASGKTALAIALAERLNGEVISCDSMQIYRGMDIGTAKPTAEEMRGIPHHLIDIVEPDEDFSAAEYATRASAAIKEIAGRGKLPIFCGGTGLYLDTVLTGTVLSPLNEGDEERLEAIRAGLLEDAARDGKHALYERLYAIDPDAALATHENNVKRVARALEIYYLTGVTKTEWDRRSRLSEPPYHSCTFAIEWDREILYERINRRVELMLEAGLVEEVRGLLSSGRLKRDSTAAQAIGYKEMLDCFDGRMTLSEAAELIKQASRRYAKRQLTYFRRNPDIHWLKSDGNFEVIVNNARKLLTNTNFCDIILE